MVFWPFRFARVLIYSRRPFFSLSIRGEKDALSCSITFFSSKQHDWFRLARKIIFSSSIFADRKMMLVCLFFPLVGSDYLCRAYALILGWVSPGPFPCYFALEHAINNSFPKDFCFPKTYLYVPPKSVNVSRRTRTLPCLSSYLFLI